MHPTLVIALAAERHADLLRTAAARRRIATVTRRDRRNAHAPTRAADALHRSLTALRRVTTSPRTQAELCCA